MYVSESLSLVVCPEDDQPPYPVRAVVRNETKQWLQKLIRATWKTNMGSEPLTASFLYNVLQLLPWRGSGKQNGQLTAAVVYQWAELSLIPFHLAVNLENERILLSSVFPTVREAVNPWGALHHPFSSHSESNYIPTSSPSMPLLPQRLKLSNH